MVGSNIYFDGAGNRWLFINNQISIVSSSGEEKVISSEQGLQTSYLSDVLVDREGIIWMASDGNGVVKMPGMNLQVFKSLDHGIPSNISALYKQSDTIWLFNVTDYHFYRIIRGNIQTFPLHKEYSKAVGIYTQGRHSILQTEEIHTVSTTKTLLLPTDIRNHYFMSKNPVSK